MAIDVAKLLTVEQTENLMANARRMGREDVYQLAFARKCELEGARHDDPVDPLVKEFWMMIAAYRRRAAGDLRGQSLGNHTELDAEPRNDLRQSVSTA